MNKYNNPRLTNTTIAGSGMKHPVRPHVIIGDPENGFIPGDLMDANAIKSLQSSEGGGGSNTAFEKVTSVTTPAGTTVNSNAGMLVPADANGIASGDGKFVVSENQIQLTHVPVYVDNGMIQVNQNAMKYTQMHTGGIYVQDLTNGSVSITSGSDIASPMVIVGGIDNNTATITKDSISFGTKTSDDILLGDGTTTSLKAILDRITALENAA